jgi:hypothetical protein
MNVYDVINEVHSTNDIFSGIDIAHILEGKEYNKFNCKYCKETLTFEEFPELERIGDGDAVRVICPICGHSAI